MEHSEKIDAIASAVVKMQGELPKIPTNRKVGRPPDNYSYADLDSILTAVRPTLKKAELGIVQSTQIAEGYAVIYTMLLHSSGQWIRNEVRLPLISVSGNEAQGAGATITYGRRYGICSILGLATEDSDARGEDAKMQALLKEGLGYLDALEKAGKDAQRDQRELMLKQYETDHDEIGMRKALRILKKEVEGTKKPKENKGADIPQPSPDTAPPQGKDFPGTDPSTEEIY